MSMMWRLACLCLVAGCATFASRGDYADYRSYRFAESLDEELAAMNQYLENQPNGHWREEVEAEHGAREQAYFTDAKETPEGLRTYLEVFPNGRFAAEARQRQSAFAELEAGRRRDEEARQTIERERREALLQSRRMWAAQAVTFWSRVLLSVENWNTPISEVVVANQTFNEAFQADPRPRCSETECVKFYSLSYAIAVPGQTRIDRQIRLQLRLHLDNERLVGAELLMPQRGFSRWYELENEEPILDEDPESRQVAIEWALTRVATLLRESMPTAAGVDAVLEPIRTILVAEADDAPTVIATPDDSLVLPVVLQALEENGMRIVAFAAADDDEGAAYDGFTVQALPPEPEVE
ncbi:MAG: hypothetical protein ACI9KE_006521 [Polyangiales bacterium]